MENIDYAALAAAAAEMEDQSEVASGGFSDELIEAGVTVGRFIEYIELGKHKQPDYNGTAKPDAEMVRVTFELLHPTKNMREYEVDGVKQKSGQLISIQMAKKLQEKAKFKKLYNKMTYGRDIKHMAQMLGEAFVLTVYHNTAQKNGKDVTYANLDSDGEFGIGAPFKVDAITQEKSAYAVPNATRPIRLFLWGQPTKATWDSLFIDGTREKKNADGSVEQISKNWMQERILSAVNYGGSALEGIVGGVADLPMTEVMDDEIPFETGSETLTTTSADLPATQTGKAAETKPAGPATVAPTKVETASDDALAALGLVTA